MTKICSDCKEEKSIIDFYKRKDSIDGFRNNCKNCHNIKNKTGTKKYQSKDSSKLKSKISNHNYWINNKEKLSLKKKEYREKNKDKLSKQKSEYYKNNKDNIIRKTTKRNKLYLTNPLYKLKENLRGLIRNSIKRKGFIKSSKTEKIIGISLDEFIYYLESKFETWMTWDNYGKYNGELDFGWDIDHIIPTSVAKTEEDIYKLNHYTNLQPLCGKINRDIKKNKI